MRTLRWKAALAAAAIAATTAYAAAQMAPGPMEPGVPDARPDMSQGQMPPAQMGMMKMMKQMSRMMDHCTNMMQGGPNGRRDAPVTPEKKG